MHLVSVLDEGTVGGDGEGPEAVELVGKVSRVVPLLRQAGGQCYKTFLSVTDVANK